MGNKTEKAKNIGKGIVKAAAAVVTIGTALLTVMGDKK